MALGVLAYLVYAIFQTAGLPAEARSSAERNDGVGWWAVQDSNL